MVQRGKKRSFRITVQDVDIAEGLYSIYKSEKKYYLSLAYKKDDGNEATEVYDKPKFKIVSNIYNAT